MVEALEKLFEHNNKTIPSLEIREMGVA